MISMKSKFKVLYPFLIGEFVLAVLLGYLSTVIQPVFLKHLTDSLSTSFVGVFCLQLFIILFSFEYKEKTGVLQRVTFSFEQVLTLIMPESYKRALALDKKGGEDGI